jgi:hypothetical protein
LVPRASSSVHRPDSSSRSRASWPGALARGSTTPLRSPSNRDPLSLFPDGCGPNPGPSLVTWTPSLARSCASSKRRAASRHALEPSPSGRGHVTTSPERPSVERHHSTVAGDPRTWGPGPSLVGASLVRMTRRPSLAQATPPANSSAKSLHSVTHSPNGRSRSTMSCARGDG